MVISKVIRNHGWTIAQLAEKMGTSPASLSNLISPTRNITVNNMRKLAEAIGCDITEFFEDETKSAPENVPVMVCPHCGKPFHVDINITATE